MCNVNGDEMLKTLKILEFDKIKSMLKGFCVSSDIKMMADDLIPQNLKCG